RESSSIPRRRRNACVRTSPRASRRPKARRRSSSASGRRCSKDSSDRSDALEARRHELRRGRRPEDKMLNEIARAARIVALLALASVGLSATARAEDAPERRFGADGFTLANGLEVVVIPNHRVPAVTQMVWYKVGGADETTGKSGIAHFLEHLMFRGT